MRIRSTIVALLLQLAIPVCGQVTDLLVSGEELCATNRMNVGAALRLLAPETSGDVLLLVDGARQEVGTLEMLSVYDVAAVRVMRNSGQQMRWCTRHQTIVELTTRKMKGGNVNATYHGDWSIGRQHRHQADVEGSDSIVGYLLSAYGVSKRDDGDQDEDDLGLRAYISYRRGGLHLHNDIGFRHSDVETGAGSFTEHRTARLTDRFGGELKIMKGLRLTGDFSFAYRHTTSDCFLSPSSDVFAGIEDARQRGSYQKGVTRDLTYEGGLQLQGSWKTERGAWRAEAGTRLYSGQLEGDSYGGIGILSDRMAYISFTLGYDTAGVRQASRQYERTLTSWAIVGYELDGRYGVNGGVSLWHSSLLAPHHRTVMRGYGEVYWKVSQPANMMVAFSHSITGFVPFSNQDFSTLYVNRNDEQYIYNYYLTGTRLVHEADEDLRPARTTTEQLSVNATWRRLAAMLRLYHEETKYAPLPANNGVELDTRVPLVSQESFRLSAGAGIRYDHLTRGHLTVQATSGPWDAHVAIGGDDDLGQSSVQLNYRFLPAKAPGAGKTVLGAKSLALGASVLNPVRWQPDGWTQPRQYVLSLSFGF